MEMKFSHFILYGILLVVTVGCSENQNKPNPELVAAVKKKDLSRVKQLIDQGISPNSTTASGSENVLGLAILQANLPMVELLLSKKASLDSTKENIFSPLHRAAGVRGGAGKKILMIRALVRAGADINKKDHAGSNALLQLVLSKYENDFVVEEVIRLGADPYVKNENGITAIDIAVENNFLSSTIEYMKNYKENRGKSTPKSGNTEGQCKVIQVMGEKNIDGLEGLYFNSDRGCNGDNLAEGVNGRYTKYDGTVCTGTWKAGVLKYPVCALTE
jgi:ankyrin repeat protein